MALSHFASAAGFVVVPGKSLGSISLGMSEDQVRAKLRDPAEFAKTPDGVLVEVWFGKAKLSGKGEDSFLRRNYLAIYYRDEKVIQIEATSKAYQTTTGLSTGTAVKSWAAQFSAHSDSNKVIPNLDPEGLPAAKHLLYYGDAITSGLAWKQGAWANLWPEPGPDAGLESIIVHMPGKKLILNPLDERPYAGTPG